MPAPKNKVTRSRKSRQIEKLIDKTGIMGLLETAQGTRRLIWVNFLIGTMRGLGFLLGTMVVVAIIVWTFKLLGGLPLIGNWVLMLIDFVRENADLSVIPTAPVSAVQSTAVTPGMAEKLIQFSN